MNDIVISVENLGKKYQIRHHANGPRYTALRDVLADRGKGIVSRFRNLVRLTFPFQHSLSDSALPHEHSKTNDEEFWALKHVSLEVRRGEILGIIGRNGAGKTTFLRILSRITEPTEGRVRIRGRVASLLEVGTGFHPELTGRENIFLNGAILGMSRMEIIKRFDEIVAFAEVEKFLDTPVKRYSSGMYVRLAFAVAAHLEPEILIVDEVLAVGDAQFQRKCLGKLDEVTKVGRTVLLVSHNMGVIQALTAYCVLFRNGVVDEIGKPNQVIRSYLNAGLDPLSDDVRHAPRISPNHGKHIRICRIKPSPQNGNTFCFGEDLIFEVHITAKILRRGLRFGITVSYMSGAPILSAFTPSSLQTEPGDEVFCRLRVPESHLSPGNYCLALSVGEGGAPEGRMEYDIVRAGPEFSIASISAEGPGLLWNSSYGYVVHPSAQIEEISKKIRGPERPDDKTHKSASQLFENKSKSAV